MVSLGTKGLDIRGRDWERRYVADGKMEGGDVEECGGAVEEVL